MPVVFPPNSNVLLYSRIEKTYLQRAPRKNKHIYTTTHTNYGQGEYLNTTTNEPFLYSRHLNIHERLSDDKKKKYVTHERNGRVYNLGDSFTHTKK